uniref:Integral membrane protein 2 n=1 Tax=Elaeophora elaphi TaxID=1147741 RepID=A0A0R3RMB2_9BILA
MTVFTKVKKAPEMKKILKSKESATVCVDSAVYQRDETGTLARIRQYKKFTSLCMIFLLLWLLVASFMAGTFFYRQFHRRPTYYGWCGTSFIQRGRNEHMEESVEINPDEYYERISVPRFGSNRPAVFVHDFRKNLTAIVDLLSNRCFIKELDRTVVAEPTSLIDFIEKMEKGHYKNPTVVRRTYRITGRIASRDIENFQSPMISHHCQHRTVFELNEASRSMERDQWRRYRRGEIF